MGVKYSAKNPKNWFAMTNNPGRITDRLSSGCDHPTSFFRFRWADRAAYTAGKWSFTEIIIPSIKKLQAAIDDIQLELTSYKKCGCSGLWIWRFGHGPAMNWKIEGRAASYRTQIQARSIKSNQKISYTELGKAFSEKTILYNTKSQIESGIQDLMTRLKTRIFCLRGFSTSADSLEVLSLAIQGATQLSKVIVDMMATTMRTVWHAGCKRWRMWRLFRMQKEIFKIQKLVQSIKLRYDAIGSIWVYYRAELALKKATDKSMG